MKAHLILELDPDIPPIDALHWRDILTDKSDAQTRLHPSVDAILDHHRTPGATHE